MSRKENIRLLAKVKNLSLDKDYFSLGASERNTLHEIMAVAKYKQPTAEKNTGRSKAYSFYLYIS